MFFNKYKMLIESILYEFYQNLDTIYKHFDSTLS